jgi:hypothetical protein
MMVSVRRNKKIFLHAIASIVWLVFFSGCAALHHVQIADVEADNNKGSPIDIKVSETGVSLDEAAAIAKGVARSQAGKEAIGDIQAIVSLFQQGPITGAPVYVETYASKILDLLREACPQGRVTNLVSTREMRKYPVVSGEIVKMTGRCITNS